jgi:hypothetical protein
MGLPEQVTAPHDKHPKRRPKHYLMGGNERKSPERGLQPARSNQNFGRAKAERALTSAFLIARTQTQTRWHR